MYYRVEQGGLSVRIAMGAPTLEFHVELRDLLLDVLSTLGHLPAPVEDGDRDVLEADVLLLVGDCSIFERFAKLFSRHEGKKPLTILWHLNPLPPPSLFERDERVGSRAVELWDRLKLPSGGLSELITSSLLPISVRTQLRRTISWALFSGFKRKLSNSMHKKFQVVDTITCRNMIHRYWWIKRRFTEGWIDFLFSSTVPAMEFLISRSIPVQFAPVGYHPWMGINLGMERDIDVLFIGTRHPRRQAILEKLQRSLVSKGKVLMTVEDGCYGKQRTELLNRARISLNLLKAPWGLPGERLLMSMGCGSLVVSEPMENPAPYIAGEHFVQASAEDLPGVITYYLAHGDERKAIVRSAYDFITQELTMEKSIKQILGACDADSLAMGSNILKRED